MPFAINDDVQVYYELTGEGDPLILLHGVADSGAMWKELGYVDRLSRHFQVVNVDQRGHGRTTRPDIAAAYATDRRIDDVIAVMDDLGIRSAHLFGYSMGGRNAINLAARFPERARSLVLGACNPYPMGLNRSLAPAPPRPRGWILRRFFRRDVVHKIKQRFRPDPEPMFIEASLRSSSVPFDDASASRMIMPILIFIGTRDDHFDIELTRQFAGLLPDVRLEVLEGQGHDLNHRPGVVLPLVEPFLLAQRGAASAEH